MDYYSQKIYVAQVDKDDNILGKIERWEAHEKAILHRGFTLAIYFNDQLLLQHRKHPVFNNVFDATVSSHQLYEGGVLQTDLKPIYSTLQREFSIQQSDLIKQPALIGKVYYQVKDPNSKYTEHEVCYFYTCTVKALPKLNLEYAYGFSLLNPEEIKKPTNSLYTALAPWVKEGIQAGLL